MRESVAIVLSLPDGRRAMQRRDDNAPSSKGMLALWGGGREAEDVCIHQGAVREISEEIPNEVALDYVGYMFYTSQLYEKPIICVSVYAGEVQDLTTALEGNIEIHEPESLAERADLASSSAAILVNLERGNIWH